MIAQLAFAQEHHDRSPLAVADGVELRVQLLEHDRRRMTEAELAESKAANEVVHKAMSLRLRNMLMPKYNPRYVPEPDKDRAYIAKSEPLAV